MVKSARRGGLRWSARGLRESKKGRKRNERISVKGKKEKGLGGDMAGEERRN